MTLRAKLREQFSEEQKFWSLLAAVTGCIAVLKGLQLPREWALTQAQIDYSQGFTKRGLLGTVLVHLGLTHYIPLCLVLLALLLAFWALVVLLTRRSGLMRTPVVVAMFASSYAVTYLTHLVGYLEIVNGTLAILLLLIRSPRLRLLAGVPVIAVASLVHESVLLLFVPVVLLTFVLDGVTAPDSSSRTRAWLYGAALAVYSATFSFATSLTAHLSPAKVAALQTTIASRVNYPVRPDFFVIMNWSLADNIKNMPGLILHNKLWSEWQLVSLFVVLLPTLLPLLWLTLRAIRSSGLPGTTERLVKIATLVSIFSPLLMNLLGWDAVRWNVLCVLAGYLTFAVLFLYLPKAKLELGPAAKNLMVLLIAINMASGWGLFDSTAVNPYPFFPKVLNAWWQARHPGKTRVGL